MNDVSAAADQPMPRGLWSCLFLQERRGEFLAVRPYPSSLPSFDGHALATTEIVEERLPQLLGQSAAEAAHVALFVVGKGSIVEVRGPHRDPSPVDDHGLLMQHGAVELEDLDV